MNKFKLKYVYYFLTLITLTLIFKGSFAYDPNEFTVSPRFAPIDIEDTLKDWNNIITGNNTTASNSSDIEAIRYSSDGRFLNATIWFKDMPELENSIVNKTQFHQFKYGILLDSDANNKTGSQGMEYLTEYRHTGDSWERVFCKLSITGKLACGNNITSNVEKFFHPKEDNIDMFIDLKDAFYPQKYRIFFYSIGDDKQNPSNKLEALDIIRSVYIPPPEFKISVSPNNFKIYSGEPERLEVEVSTVTSLTPTINLGITEFPLGIEKPEFQNNSITINPKSKSAKTELTVTAKSDAQPRTNASIVIEGNIVFPTEYYETAPSVKAHKPIKIPIQSINETIYSNKILIDIEKSKPPVEIILDAINKLANPIVGVIATAITIISGILGLNIWKKKTSSSKLKPPPE
jgi:hypothetical protein